MGMLLCEQNFRDVWSRNESVRAEIGQILHTDTHTAKLVVEIIYSDKYSVLLLLDMDSFIRACFVVVLPVYVFDMLCIF